MAERIEDDVVAGFVRTMTIASVVAAVALVLMIGGVVLAVQETIGAAAAAVAITAALVAAAAAIATVVHARMVVQIGRRHGWQTMACEVREAGVGRTARTEITVNRFVHLQPWDALSNSAAAWRGRTTIEIAGDLTGRVLVRAPGTHRIGIFRSR